MEVVLSPGSWLLPAIALLSGLVSLQVDPQKEPRKKWILVAMLAISAVGTVLVSRHDDNVKQVQEDEANTNIDFLKKTVTNLTGQSQHISQTTDSVLLLLENSGVAKSTIRLVQQTQAAEVSRSAILEQTKSNNQQQKAVVWYFPKNVDGPKVVAALEQGGFSVVQKSGNPLNESFATNAVWVGDNVTLDQAKFVALTLIRAGVEIKAIQRLRNGQGARSSLIEVGVDQALQAAPPMSADTVSKLAELPLRNGSSGPSNER
jgi:hypothetical protein